MGVTAGVEAVAGLLPLAATPTTPKNLSYLAGRHQVRIYDVLTAARQEGVEDAAASFSLNI